MDLQEKFTLIYNEHADAIFRHVYYRINDRERALELMQGVFAGLWKRMADGAQVEHPQAFLYASARNATINEWRDRKANISLESLMEAGGDIPYDDADAQELAAQKEAVGKLQHIEEPYREALTLRYVDDLPVQQIAQILGENPNTISVRIKRGLEKLRRLYG